MGKLSNSPAVAATPKTKAKKVRKSYVQRARDLTLSRYIIIVHGPRGAGKTRLAATASKYWPGKVPAAKPVHLKDMLWLSMDAGATDTMGELGVDADCMELTGLLNDQRLWKDAGWVQRPTMLQVLNLMTQEAIDFCQGDPDRTVVVDTISTMDRHLNTYAKERTVNSTNKYAKYNVMLEVHSQFHERLKFGCRRIIYLCHSKAMSEDANTAQKKKNLATKSPGLPDIIPSITGQGADVYINDASLELSILANSRLNGNKKGIERTVYPLQNLGFEAKSRFELSLNQEEKPHLGKIFNKIRKNIK